MVMAIATAGGGYRPAHHRLGRPAAAVAIGALHEVKEADGLVFNAVHHRLEQNEGLFLVLDQRVFLAIGPHADTFLQVVHRQ